MLRYVCHVAKYIDEKFVALNKSPNSLVISKKISYQSNTIPKNISKDYRPLLTKHDHNTPEHWMVRQELEGKE
jgi:hypothetical protein